VDVLEIGWQGSYRSWKVWKVLQFNVIIFKGLKSLENDDKLGEVWKNL